MIDPPVRSGVLVLSLWCPVDGSAKVRARLRTTLDVERCQSATTVAAGIEEITELVRVWVEYFIADTERSTRGDGIATRPRRSRDDVGDTLRPPGA